MARIAALDMERRSKMGLIETEVTELRELLTSVMDGKTDMKTASMQLAIYSQVAKRERLMFDIWKASGNQKGLMAKATSKNLLERSSAIVCGSEAGVKFVCPEKGGALISPEHCMDFSGDSKNIDVCQKCENFTVSRKKVLNNK